MTKETMKRLKYRCCVMSYIKARKALLSEMINSHTDKAFSRTCEAKKLSVPHK